MIPPASAAADDASAEPRVAWVWPYALFTLSGFAALVLEAVFVRQLSWLLGSSAVATSLVLATFMAGLALGAVAFGRIADRSPRPLRLFGLLELGTAVTSLALVWLLGDGRELFLAPLARLPAGGARKALELTLAFALLLVPTVLMGGTLPALSRGVIRRMDRFAAALGLLYGLNTLGAAVGAFVAGFYLFELLGISGAARVAVLVQLSVGGAALLLARGPAATRAVAGPPPPGEATASAGAARVCLAAAAGSGLATLGYEVVWTRVLSLPMRSFSYSFSLMLALFLLGLVIGALALAVLAPRVSHPARWVGWLLLLMGVWVAVSLFWLPGRLAPVGGSGFHAFLALATLRAVPVVVPPVLLSGMVLPLAARGFAHGTGRVGRDVGLVYGSNTAGAIVGALAAGLLLLPALGAPRALATLATVNAATGAAVLVVLRRPVGQLLLAFALLAVAAAPLAFGNARYVEAFLGAARGAEHVGELLFFHEGAADTVGIVRKRYGFRDPQAKSLITNGVAMSATVKPVWRYMAAEGHLPVLLSPRPQRALVIGIGTGITLGAVAAHPEVDSITAVELSDGVLKGLELFEAENDGAWHDPRVRLIHEDGRHWLALADEAFDLITLEPPPPIVAGSVHLYSLDFYRLCRARLTTGGVVAQWLPLHAQSLASAKMAAHTFLEAFPHVTLWLPSVRDAVLIGSTAPQRMTLDRLRAAFGRPRTRRNLERAYLETPEALLGTLLLDRQAIEAWSAGAPSITDEHPLMEFFRHQGGNLVDADIAGLLELAQANWRWVDGLESQPDLLRRIEHENHVLRLYVRSLVERDTEAGARAARLARGSEFPLYPLGCTSAQLETLRASESVAADVARHIALCAGLRAPSDAP